MWWAVCFARVESGSTLFPERTDGLLFFLSGHQPLTFRRRESRRASGSYQKVWLSWLKAILCMYVRCRANISDHRGVECPATIIAQYQVTHACAVHVRPYERR
jgi:hypothetical protein